MSQLGRSERGHTHQLVPGLSAADELEVGRGYIEQVGEEPEQRLVGGALDRWRGKPHDENLASSARHLGAAAAGLHAHGEQSARTTRIALHSVCTSITAITYALVRACTTMPG